MKDLDQFVFNQLCNRDALGMTRQQLDALEAADKTRLLALLVEEIKVDAAAGVVNVTFRDAEARRESA